MQKRPGESAKATVVEARSFVVDGDLVSGGSVALYCKRPEPGSGQSSDPYCLELPGGAVRRCEGQPSCNVNLLSPVNCIEDLREGVKRSVGKSAAKSLFGARDPSYMGSVEDDAGRVEDFVFYNRYFPQISLKGFPNPVTLRNPRSRFWPISEVEMQIGRNPYAVSRHVLAVLATFAPGFGGRIKELRPELDISRLAL